MEGPIREFHLEEFRQLKAEIAVLLLRIGSLFRYSMISSTIIYSWLLTASTQSTKLGTCLKIPAELLTYATIIPPIYVGSSLFIAHHTNLQIKVIGKYIKKTENYFAARELGWEQYWSIEKPSLTKFFQGVWTFLLIGCIFASLRLSFYFYEFPTCTQTLNSPNSRNASLVDLCYNNQKYCVSSYGNLQLTLPMPVFKARELISDSSLQRPEFAVRNQSSAFVQPVAPSP